MRLCQRRRDPARLRGFTAGVGVEGLERVQLKRQKTEIGTTDKVREMKIKSERRGIKTSVDSHGVVPTRFPLSASGESSYKHGCGRTWEGKKPQSVKSADAIVFGFRGFLRRRLVDAGTVGVVRAPLNFTVIIKYVLSIPTGNTQ